MDLKKGCPISKKVIGNSSLSAGVASASDVQDTLVSMMSQDVTSSTSANATPAGVSPFPTIL